MHSSQPPLSNFRLLYWYAWWTLMSSALMRRDWPKVACLSRDAVTGLTARYSMRCTAAAGEC